MDQADHQKQQLIRWIQTEVARSLGRRYAVKLELLDAASLRDLQRILRDLDHEKQMAVRNAEVFPWR
ncbi:MAG: hypothetical protein ABI333_08815 [bacterium]